MDISQFLDDVTMAKATYEGADLPCLEVDRKLCEHYNREHLAEFDKTGYFVFHGVKVYEKGKRDYADGRDALTTEDICHRGKKRD